MGEIAQILNSWTQGEPEAPEELLPIIYHELCNQARRYLQHERQGHTLDTSGLVHEAYLRLLDQRRIVWKNRRQFFGIAGRMMRRILVDHARGRSCAKRGEGKVLVSLEDALPQMLHEQTPDLLALDEALTSLAEVDPQQVQVVEMRFFAGMSAGEIAESLGISTATVSRRWRAARAWLYSRLVEDLGEPGRVEADRKGLPSTG